MTIRTPQELTRDVIEPGAVEHALGSLDHDLVVLEAGFTDEKWADSMKHGSKDVLAQCDHERFPTAEIWGKHTASGQEVDASVVAKVSGKRAL